MKQLKEILLVDDSKATNVLNERLLSNMEIAAEITVALNGKEALDYLSTPKPAGHYPAPEIIFLDINMPVMDGFQFLEKHQSLKAEWQAKHIIVMLTSSIDPADRERARALGEEVDFLNKPLTEAAVHAILAKLD